MTITNLSPPTTASVLAPPPLGAGQSDTAQLAALLSSGVTLLLRPNAVYLFATALTIPSGAKVIGGGPTTTCRATANNYVFVCSDHTQITNLKLDAQAAQTAGGGIQLNGIVITVADLTIGNNLYYGIDGGPAISNIGLWWIQRIRFANTTESGAVAGVQSMHTAIRIGNGANHITDVLVADVIGSGNSTADVGTWISVDYADTVYLRDIDCYQGTSGLMAGLNGGSAANINTGMKLARVTMDTMSGQGMNFQFSRDTDLTDCNVQTCSASYAMFVNGCNAFKMKGGTVQNNANYGITISGGSYHVYDGVLVVDNNTSNANYQDGIAQVNATTHFKIVNCIVGNGVTTANGHQRYGISTAGAADYYWIYNNDCPANVTGVVGDAATGAHKFVGQNQ